MKRTLLLLILGLGFGMMGWGQIVAWETNGLTGGGSAPWSATTVAANISGTPQLTVGSGCNTVGGTPPGNAFVRTSMTATNLSGAISGNDYFEFSISPSLGYAISFSTIDANFRRTSTGANNYIFQYSLDGFATAGIDIGSSATYTNNTNGVAISQISLSAITNLQSVLGSVSFRLYWWGETGSTQSAGLGRLTGNDLAIGGTIASAGTTSPTVTTQAVTLIGTTTATFNGNITANGGAEITDRGFCYKTEAGVTIDDNKTSEGGTTTGTYSKEFSSLTAGTQYYYRAYATNAVGTTLSSTEISFTTFSNQPTNHPTGFTATANSQTTITTLWADNDPDPGQVASGFLVMANITGTFTDPVDGVAQADDNNLSDDAGVVNVAHGVQTYEWNNGLDAGTQYFFKIFAYNGTGSSINYKTDETVPADDATTFAPNEETTEVDGPEQVNQPDPLLISSLADTDAEAVNVFDMDIYDYGVDGLQTQITQLTIRSGDSDDADWTQTIQGVKLSIDEGANFITIGTVTINAESIVIAVPLGNLNVPDDDAITVSLYIYLKTTVTDNKTLQFSVSMTDHGFVADGTGSGFAAAFTNSTTSNVMMVDVEASKLNFVVQPTNTLVNADMLPAVTVEALDVNNNRDLDATDDVTITSTGTLADTQVTALINGLATFSNIMHTATGSGLQLTATATGMNNTVSSFFDIFMELSAGDLIFVGYGTDNPDKFAFLPLTNIDGGAQIKFTDNAWTGTVLATNEGTLQWTAPTEGVSIGTVVTINGLTTASLGTVAPFGTGTFALAADGDQIIAYQGSSSSPGFIAGVSSTGWISSGLTSSNSSYLPAALTLFESAISFSTETDNGYYSGATTLSADVSRALVCHPDNWLRDNTLQVFPSWAFSIGLTSSINANATANALTIGTGETLEVNTGATLTVTGDVLMAPDSFFDIFLESFCNIGGNLTIVPTSFFDIFMEGFCSVDGTIDNQAGNAGLVIHSDANGTGGLLHYSADVPATVERYLPGITGNDNGWHMISSPMVTQAIAPNFIDPTPANYDFFAWGENTGTWLNQKVGAHNITAFEPGKGYLAAYLNNSTRNFEGQLTVANTSPTVTYTTGKGYNLIGNPFACPINANILAWTKTNVDDAVWVYNEVDGNYLSYNGSTGTLPGGIIPAMQGFFVKTNADDPTLTIPATSRTTGNTNVYKEGLMDALLLHAIAPNGQKDGLVVWFNPSAVTDVDRMDVARLSSLSATAPHLYTKIGDQNYSINTLPYAEEARIVPLYFSAGIDGNYSISASQLETFDGGTIINLEDTKTGQFQNLMTNPVYNFTASSEDDAARFKLHFAGTFGIENPDQINPVRIYADGNTIHLNPMGNTLQNTSIGIYNLLGQELYSNQTDISAPISVKTTGFKGICIVKVKSGNLVISQKVFIQ